MQNGLSKRIITTGRVPVVSLTNEKQLFVICLVCGKLFLMAEQGKDNDNKIPVLLTAFRCFTRFSASMRKKIDLKGKSFKVYSGKFS